MRCDYFPWGCEYYLKTGRMMADDALEILRGFDAIYFGAVGFPSVPDHISLRGLRLPICQGFEQYVCQRPSNPERDYPSMFEPVHGSAPDIFGKGIANPIAMIWCGAMMLEFLGEKTAADLILRAIQAVTADGTTRTPDLGGTARTAQMTDAIIAQARQLAARA